MTVIPLSITEAVAQDGANFIVTVDYSDFSAAATTETLNLLADDGVNLPANSVVELKSIKTTTAFAAAGLTNLTVNVGDGGTAARFASAADIDAAGYAAVSGLTRQDYQYTSADTVDGAFTATGANLSTLTAGQVQFLFRVILP